MMKLKNILNEYGGSDFSKITSLQNYLTIDLDKFEKGLKDSKHKAIYKKARKQFMKVVSDVAWEHHKLHESKAHSFILGRNLCDCLPSVRNSNLYVLGAFKNRFDPLA